MNWREDLLALVVAVPDPELVDLLGELTRAQAHAYLRMRPPAGNGEPKTARALDRYLTAGEVAERLGLSDDWVYRHSDELGAVKLGGAVRFPERAVVRYLKSLGS